MNIERILRDLNGTVVPMGGTIYHFKPLWEGGPHVSQVEDEQHQRVFLSIPEGYRPYDGAIPKAGATPVLAPAVKAPNAPAPQPVADPVEPDLDTPAHAAATTDTPADDLEALDDAALRALFKDEIGRVASPKSKPETMIAQIRAKRDAGATE